MMKLEEQTAVETLARLVAQEEKRLKSEALQKYKKPTTNHRYVGIEIEFFCDADNEGLENALIEAELDQYCQVWHDGSIEPDNIYQNSFELKVLVKEMEVESVLSRIFRVLKALGGAVNSTCGLHVHLDMRGRNVKRSYHNLVQVQDLLYRMCPADRRYSDGEYCKPCAIKDFESAYATLEDRYYGINVMCMDDKQTLEVRIMHGSLTSIEVVQWIRLLHLVIRNRRYIDHVTTLHDLLTQVKPDLTLRRHILQRVNKYREEHDEFDQLDKDNEAIDGLIQEAEAA